MALLVLVPGLLTCGGDEVKGVVRQDSRLPGLGMRAPGDSARLPRGAGKVAEWSSVAPTPWLPRVSGVRPFCHPGRIPDRMPPPRTKDFLQLGQAWTARQRDEPRTSRRLGIGMVKCCPKGPAV